MFRLGKHNLCEVWIPSATRCLKLPRLGWSQCIRLCSTEAPDAGSCVDVVGVLADSWPWPDRCFDLWPQSLRGHTGVLLHRSSWWSSATGNSCGMRSMPHVICLANPPVPITCWAKVNSPLPMPQKVYSIGGVALAAQGPDTPLKP